ncbi:MAG: hypothetical protein H7841_00545 [Magnetospirillum sp. WYHS-4]
MMNSVELGSMSRSGPSTAGDAPGTMAVDGRQGRRDRAWIAFLLFLFGLVAIARYGGAPDHYMYAYMLANDPALLPFDSVMNNNILLKSSIFYDINRYLRIEEREVLLLAIYVAISALNIGLVFTIVRRHLTADRLAALTLVLLLTFVDRKLNTNAWSLMFAAHPGSPSMFGNSFALLTLLWLLDGRIALAALAMMGVFLFQVKENTLLIPAALFFVASLGREYWWRGVFVLIPVGWLAFRSWSVIGQGYPYDDMIAAFRVNLEIEGRDGSFLAHTPAANLLLLGVVAASFPLSRLLNRDLGLLLRAVAWATLAMWLANVLYLTVLWPYRPDPQPILLGAVRNSRFLIFLAFLAALGILAFKAPLRSYEKAMAMLSLFLVHGESWKGAAGPVLVLVLGIGLPRLLERISALRPLAGRAAALPWYAWCVAVFVAYGSWQAYSGGVYGTAVNRLAFEYSGRFAVIDRIDRAGWEALRRIRGMAGGGPMLTVFQLPEGGYAFSRSGTTFARKARFVAAGCQGLRMPPERTFFAEVDRRLEMEEALLASLKAGRPVPESLRRDLAERGVWILVPDSAAAGLEGYGEPTDLDGYRLFRP